MANRDGIVSYQDVLHNQPDYSLPLSDTQRISSAAQAGKKRGKIFRQPQKSCLIICLVSNCLQLRTERLFALAKPWHALPQLVDRHECFLVCAEKAFDAFAHMHQFSLQTLLTFFGRI